MTRNGWLTPDEIPAQKVCRYFYIPEEYEYIVPAVMGALYPLTQAENWEKFGAVTPEQMAATMLKMYFSIENCQPMTTRIIGEIIAFAGDTAPAGWLKCDGATVSRVTYAELFAVIGEVYGPGDGSTNFQIPDTRGRVVGAAGQPAGSPTNWPAGTMSGTEQITLSVDQMPAHAHSRNTSNGGSGRFISAFAGGQMDNAGPQSDYWLTGSAGGGQPHNNVQPTLFANMHIIYAGV